MRNRRECVGRSRVRTPSGGYAEREDDRRFFDALRHADDRPVGALKEETRGSGLGVWHGVEGAALRGGAGVERGDHRDEEPAVGVQPDSRRVRRRRDTVCWRVVRKRRGLVRVEVFELLATVRDVRQRRVPAIVARREHVATGAHERLENTQHALRREVDGGAKGVGRNVEPVTLGERLGGTAQRPRRRREPARAIVHHRRLQPIRVVGEARREVFERGLSRGADARDVRDDHGSVERKDRRQAVRELRERASGDEG